MGAFGTLQLEDEPRAHTPTKLFLMFSKSFLNSRLAPTHNRSNSQPQNYNYTSIQKNTPILGNSYAPVPKRENIYVPDPRRNAYLDPEQNPYHPTTVSNGEDR